jgi:hypothetical protein
MRPIFCLRVASFPPHCMIPGQTMHQENAEDRRVAINAVTIPDPAVNQANGNGRAVRDPITDSDVSIHSVDFGGCKRCHANRTDLPCTCSEIELESRKVKRALIDGRHHQHRQQSRRSGCRTRCIRCCGCIDMVSHYHQGSSAIGGLLGVVVVILVGLVFALQAYQFVATPDIILSESVPESTSDHLALLGGCRYQKITASGLPAPIICIIVTDEGATIPLVEPMKGADYEGADVFASYISVRSRSSTRTPVFTVIAAFNPFYMQAATSLPPGDGNPPIPSFVVGTSVRTESADVAQVIPYTAEELRLLKPFSPTQTMLPERHGRDSTVSLRRYTERVNTEVSFLEDVSKAADDGTSDRSVSETTWGYVPATVFGPINCTRIITQMAYERAMAAIPVGGASAPPPSAAVVSAAFNQSRQAFSAAGIIECAALHYIVVGDRLKSTTLPARTWWEILVACAGLWAFLYGAASGVRSLHYRWVLSNVPKNPV